MPGMAAEPAARDQALARFAANLEPNNPAGASPDERAKVLTTLYQEYSKRFIADNNRIWTTAASMVPLSFGAFAILASLSKPSLGQVIALPIIGWLLMTVWLIIAENHRAFQDRSISWLLAIERAWDVPPDEQRTKPGLLVRPGLIRLMRFALWWIVTLAALLTILFWPGGVLVSS